MIRENCATIHYGQGDLLNAKSSKVISVQQLDTVIRQDAGYSGDIYEDGVRFRCASSEGGKE